MEHPPDHESHSVLLEPELKRLIEKRGIRPEDLPAIEELSVYPNELIILLLHNHFNSNKERSAEELERIIGYTNDPDHLRVYELFRQMLSSYDWATCYNLVRVLEERKGTTPLLKWQIERGKN